MRQQQIEALLFPLSTYMKQDGLLVVIFKPGIGPMVKEEFHYLIGLFMVYQYGSDIESRLPGLCFQSINDGRVVLF